MRIDYTIKTLDNLYKRNPLIFAIHLLGIQQKDLAKVLGCTTATASNYFNGYTVCKEPFKLIKLIKLTLKEQRSLKLSPTLVLYRNHVHYIVEKILEDIENKTTR